MKALKTADELYPDKPNGSSGSGAGRHADYNFAAGGGGSIGKARQSLSKPLPRPPRSKKARSFAPNLTEIFLILSGQSWPLPQITPIQIHVTRRPHVLRTAPLRKAVSFSTVVLCVCARARAYSFVI